MTRCLAIAAVLAMLGAAPAAAINPLPPVAHYYPLEVGGTVDAAIAETKAGGRLAVIVFGADWCSDSRSLAAFLTSEMFRVELGSKFNVVLVDVFKPTRGAGRNQDIVRRLGIEKMIGTPEMLVIGRDGKALNSIADAQSWQNAGDRSILSIYRWFQQIAQKAEQFAE